MFVKTQPKAEQCRKSASSKGAEALVSDIFRQDYFLGALVL